MRFSIIVPVYNVEQYLPKCIESILGQDYEDFEVILVDDGSEDGSGKLCDEYMERDARVHVIHQKNLGLSGARNTGLDAAMGDWIVFVDGDDWIEPRMLRTLTAGIDDNPADLYRFNMRKVDEKGNEVERLLYCVENENVVFTTEQERFEFCFQIFMQYKMGWEVCGGVYQRGLIESKKIRFLRTQDIFAEDYLFTFEYLLSVHKICRLCYIFYDYMQRGDSLLGRLSYATVLPRLMEWGERGYEYLKSEKQNYFMRHYEKLYFMLINYHVRYMLSAISMEEIMDCLQNQGSGRHNKWMKKLRKDKSQWEKYMGSRIWL